MIQRHTDLSVEDRDMLAQWAVSASRCWLALSAGAVLAGLAHLIDLV
jgi:hypothetical protein